MQRKLSLRAVFSGGAIVSALGLFAGAAAAQISFPSSATLAIASLPDNSAAGDFDGDGDLDLATTADAPDRVVVRLNTGGGAFGAPTGVATGAGTSPHGISAGDFDGDGDVDLLVSLKNVASVRMLVNGGGASFALGSLALVGAEPRNVESADLDGDGDRDAVVVNRSSNTVSVLLNAGNGSFASTSHPAGSDPRVVALGDLSGDGRADLAVSSHDSRQIVVLRNAGGGAFVAHATLGVNPTLRPEGVTIADLDGDGDGDIASTTGGPEFLTVFLNAGGGSFGAFQQYPIGGVDGSFLVAVDLDADGDRDVAAAMTGSAAVALLANDGAGGFGAAQMIPAGAGAGHVLAADLDGNGSADLAVTNDAGNSVTVLLNGNGGDPGSAVTYCVTSPNSAGAGALIGHTGSLSVSANGFALTIGGGVPNQNGVFFYGNQQTQVPFGDGVRCVGGDLFRLQPATAIDANGDASRALDFTQLPAGGQITGGSSWNFQFWYRDPTGPGGTGTNSSNALHVVFAP
jgi:hypothetical protein